MWKMFCHLDRANSIATKLQTCNLPVQKLKAWRRFFYNDKSWNSKRYLFANVKSFWHLMWKTFCHSGWANSIKTDLQTCNSRTGQYVSYKSVNQFWLNLHNQNRKMIWHQMSKSFHNMHFLKIEPPCDFCKSFSLLN